MTTILETSLKRSSAELTWLEISRNALLGNLRNISNRFQDGTKTLAVIKANAYGHGLLEVAECLRDEVEFFGVSTIEEAMLLRQKYENASILLFGIHSRDSIRQAVQARISLCVSGSGDAREIFDAAVRAGIPAKIHVKIDTGMGRLGIPVWEAQSEIRHISMMDMVYLEGIFTHFAQSERPDDSFTLKQIASFTEIIEWAERNGIHFLYRHASNSGGVFNYPEARLNLVRPGIALYGMMPGTSVRPGFEPEAVLSWKARIIQLKNLSKGESTGYGRTYITDRDTTIGIIPVGYSHGYPFGLSNKGVVLCGGKRYPVAGRVSMDYLAIDFGADGGKIRKGDIVTLIGRDGDETISAELLAGGAKTIVYEIVTRIGAHLPRIVV